ncbi:TorF family putative porin [Pseudomonas sp. PhalM4]
MKTIKKYVVPALFFAPWTFANAIDLGDDFILNVNVGAVSNYWSRGMSQTQNDPALQGGATIAHSSGAYAGVWTSNVDFGNGSKTRQEIDYFVGYYWEPIENFSWDVAYYKYEYPRRSELNYNEYYTKLTAYGFNIGGWYSDNLYGDQSYLYSFVGYTTKLPLDTSLDLTYGKVDYKDNYFFSKNGGERDSFNSWIAKLSKSVFGVKWSIAYADSNLSKAECASFIGFDDVCSSTVIFGAEKTF